MAGSSSSRPDRAGGNVDAHLTGRRTLWRGSPPVKRRRVVRVLRKPQNALQWRLKHHGSPEIKLRPQHRAAARRVG